MNKRYGMTLVELVVVCIIILFLAFVFFPFPLYTNKEKAKAASCMSNVKQIELATLQYIQDYDETLPLRQTVDNDKTVSWRKSISTYTKTKEIFRCISNPYGDWPDTERDGFPRSYALNATSPSGKSIGGPFADRKKPLMLIKLANPALTVMVTETTAAFNDFNPLNPGVFMAKPGKDHNAGSLFIKHDKGHTIIGFADGHVKRFRREALLDPIICNWTADTKQLLPKDKQTLQQVINYAANVKD